MITRAGQPEILRAAQRDDDFQKQIYDKVSELIQMGLGVHVWILYKEHIKLLINLVYNASTTLSNIQTLGEEYTGLIQIHKSGESLPSKLAQIIMILLKVLGETSLTNILRNFETYVMELPSDHPFAFDGRMKMVKLISIIRNSVPYLQHFHKAAFYSYGSYYHLSKRITRIEYALARSWLKDNKSLLAFKHLGYMLFAQLILQAMRKFQTGNIQASDVNIIEREKKNSSISEDKCSLCLNNCDHPSIIPCGHRFCWSCIVPWLAEQPKCPLCRQDAKPSRVVLLQNYAKL